MKGWFSSTCRAFILTALLCFTIGIFNNPEIATNAYITAYGITGLAVLLLITNFFSIMIRGTETSVMSILYNLFMGGGPFIFMLAVIALVLYKTFKYRTNIIHENVGTDYVWYSEAIVLLIFLQLIIIYIGLDDEVFYTTGTIAKWASSALYLFSILSSISYITMNSILTYSTTDGFHFMQ